MFIHVVRSGETLWQIANRYNVSMNGIIQANGLENPNRLVIGQSLVIPVPSTTHIIRSGETLWLISQHYGVSINSIVQVNQLTDPNVLNPGMKLIIPPRIHITQPGETLWLIANRYGVTIQSIIRENNIQDPNLIYPGLQLRIPHRKPNIEVNAYSYQSDASGAQTIRELGDFLTYHSPFAYLINENGELQPVSDELMIAAARAENVVPMMSITNFTSTAAGSNLAHTILATPELRDRVITNMLRIMEQKGYRGVNIDYENVLPADRENYNQFLQLTVDRLHPRGYFVSTAVAPKVSATQAGLLYEAHDYEAHGRIADFVVLMTYEWGYRLGPPQAISPINQMRRVVEYARSVMPTEKIFLGFQIYARDWLLPHVQGQEAETFSTQEAVARAVNYGASIQYDNVTQSPFFRYVDEQGRSHEVWFEDARSAQAKFDLAKEFNLRGISYWALGYPYPSNWVLLNENFNIRKINQ
ncbi:spore gernimation protein [Bacillus sp. SA1-12]|uniref:LysM peptidoglycan-binding domain-containing protein n=1 Tax=Bacillus sp. SA1-12 TaxID=1455638 RepID=UPI000626F334|nr:LysM peptidoglycan-binding domain-containing protein [Bacillus sp. SA1-12]KKI88926.1 spore gernimation protein [Bacillus sp. SA1-12]